MTFRAMAIHAMRLISQGRQFTGLGR